MSKAKILIIGFSLIVISLSSCNNLVKNDNVKIIVEEGTQIDSIQSKKIKKEIDITGTYVGIFEVDLDDSTKWAKSVTAGEAFHWTRENKITLFIDSIDQNNIKGHTVVAGNNRPFEGTISKNDTASFVEAKEPGNNKNDGTFSFILKDTIINGIWKAFAKIEIEKRKYSLVKKQFKYDPNQALIADSRYIDWNKPEMSEAEKKRILSKMSKEEREEFYEFEEDTHFASATKKIYLINASSTLLTENDLTNLNRGDLFIIRNTIYARHGYSFKSRPLRVFFDRQSWYIPVSTDIKATFTDTEKKNITLLLKYEKIAKEYYDYFGRG
ncbi:YARHG domain-containing protein [Ferruginibacter lapsinanis]|uniref:YARHG domain-containing protein n=1 Tax=Ferruginibacter lapsinanis TaxID=563172 RepID=UPI001E5651D4|nr:YARHG domain-containing protein [Ferruginibacter lapsinanis]UEG49146.1 YARHG domain-containing protein [Ferruginibacter lapsinanis]